MRVSHRCGSALLDVVVSLVVLGLTGTALITVMGQTRQTARQVRTTERLARGASDALGWFVTFDRTRLIAMSGRNWMHGWRVEVTRETPDLFDVSIAESDTSAVLLRTTVYRPPGDSSNAP